MMMRNSTSETDFDSELQLPAGIGVTDHAETAVGVGRIGHSQIRVVEDVSSRGLELQVPSLAEHSQGNVLQ